MDPASRPAPAVTAELATVAAREHGLPAGLLDGYLDALVAVARTGRRLRDAEEAACRRLGGEAAAGGVALPRLVDLYMTASRLLWPCLPELITTGGGGRTADLVAVGEAVWRAADTAVAALAEGHVDAQRQVVRREEAFRREFVEDLLTGRSEVGPLVERAERFGLSLAAAHTVVVAVTDRPVDSGMPTTGCIEDDVRTRLGPRGLLVAVRDGRLVLVLSSAPGRPPGAGAGAEGEVLAAVAGPAAARLTRRTAWRAGVGRPHTGPRGVLRSYREAVDALTVAAQLDLPQRVVHAPDMLVYRVLLRDEEAIADLVGTVLGPLTTARGGAEPLLRTLECYFASGRNSAETARRLHLSVRAVTYRLARLHELTGHRPGDPAAELPLLVAVTGARLLDWPGRPLPVM
ncbi:transcriptional regulator, CdaR family [Geodermatophilus pulveris]|uniref:Transcriptional regulator, CdaR family n=1 Tax=Geodermatophilus pulveris TaxID=1564159 RepID=A0A239EMA3_9ACTN|nr:helix-turn-helix domain-containing protein [Geodermatophilus pulveris]SNS45689.1 transcriptional regulator, CdaR family [Geodermatophilus pulveris]